MSVFSGRHGIFSGRRFDPIRLGLTRPTGGGWVFPGAVGHLDFKRGRYHGGVPATSRSSPQQVVDSAGVYSSVGPNILPRSDLGVVPEGAGTNAIRNPRMVGAAFDTTELVPDGNFSSQGAWATANAAGSGGATISGGALTISGDGTNTSAASRSIETIIGRTYLLALDVAGNTVNLSVGSAQGSSNLFAGNIAAAGSGTPNTVTFTASTTTTWIRLARAGIAPATVDNVSVQWQGTLPTYWSIGNLPAGVTWQVVGLPTQSGLPAIDLRWRGVAGAAGTPQVRFDVPDGIAAAQNQVRTLSAFYSIIGGTQNGVSNFRLVYDEYGAGPAYITGDSSPFVPSATWGRYSYTRTLSGVGTAFARSDVQFSVTSGAAVDITTRVGPPQEELSARMTSPMLPAPGIIGNGSTTNGQRDASLIDFALPGAPYAGDLTAIFVARRPLVASPGQTLGQLRNPAVTDLFTVREGSTNTVLLAITTNGSGQALTFPSTPPPPPGARFCFAVSLTGAGGQAISRDGGAPVSATTDRDPGGFDVLRIGSSLGNGTSFWGAEIEEVIVVPTALAGAALQAVSNRAGA